MFKYIYSFLYDSVDGNANTGDTDSNVGGNADGSGDVTGADIIELVINNEGEIVYNISKSEPKRSKRVKNKSKHKRKATNHTCDTINTDRIIDADGSVESVGRAERAERAETLEELENFGDEKYISRKKFKTKHVFI